MEWRLFFTTSLLSSLPPTLIPRGFLMLGQSAHVCAVRRTSTAVAGGWSYEDVDASTGRTPLDVLYEERLERIRSIFEAPLPPLPRDGNVRPDFLVGFAHYEYRLRDQYRAVLAKSLGIPVLALQLSVAWSGRFDVSRFNRVRKVCGVRVVMGNTEKTNEEMQGGIGRIVRAINERRSEALLAVHIVQASEAIPEVEFAASERDAIAAERLHKWIRQHILKPHLVVFFYGANEAGSGSKGHYSWDADKQRLLIENKWLKAFFHRHVVPYILSFLQLTELVGDAVQRGEVEGVAPLLHKKHADKTKEGDSGKNNDDIKTDEGLCKEEKDAGRVFTDGASTAQGSENLKILLPLDNKTAWHNLVRRAVFWRHDDRATFPLFFIHGECAGGVDEMRYLLHNREAFDAVLLHPNDVAFKSKFMSRFRSSHSRLCMAEEMSA